jgi:hypothetical protein
MIRAAKVLGVTVDYMIDERHGWPPPEARSGIVLTREQENIIRWADDLGYELARRRLLALPEIGLAVAEAPARNAPGPRGNGAG